MYPISLLYNQLGLDTLSVSMECIVDINVPVAIPDDGSNEEWTCTFETKSVGLLSSDSVGSGSASSIGDCKTKDDLIWNVEDSIRGTEDIDFA